MLSSAKRVNILLIPTLSLNLLGLFLSFHVPCGSTFYQTGLCYRPLFKDFPSEVRASEPLSNGDSLTQEIQVACDGLSEIRVLVRPSKAAAQRTTRFLLEDGSGTQTLLDTSIADNQIPAEDWLPMQFEPDWDSAGKQYRLEISSMNGSSDQGLQLFYTPQSEFNLGDAYENGQALEQDLLMQYGCVTGLRKLWMTGKP